MSKAVWEQIVFYYTTLSPCPSWQMLLTDVATDVASRLWVKKSTPGATSVPSLTDSMSGSGQCSPSQHTFLPTRIPKSRTAPLSQRGVGLQPSDRGAAADCGAPAALRSPLAPTLILTLNLNLTSNPSPGPNSKKKT